MKKCNLIKEVVAPVVRLFQNQAKGQGIKIELKADIPQLLFLMDKTRI